MAHIDLTRIIPPRYWRNFLIVLLVLLALSAIGMVVLVIQIVWTLEISPQQLTSLPPWAQQILVPILQKYSKTILVVISTVGFAFVCLVLFVGVSFLRSDKLKLWGIEFQISEELATALRELEVLSEREVGLKENFREIQDLIQQQSHLFLNQGVDEYFDYLDKIVETAAFIVRSHSRAVRAAIWLHRKSTDELRIVAGYRIPQQTFRQLVLKLDGEGFASHVLRSGGPQAKDNPTPGREWKPEPDNIMQTTSILGQPIEVGRDDDDWQAVLCFSTDRDIKRFPEYAFSVSADANTLLFFSGIISSALTLAIPLADAAGKPLLEIIHERYT